MDALHLVPMITPDNTPTYTLERKVIKKIQDLFEEADTNMSRVERQTGIPYHRIRGIIILNTSPTVSEAVTLLQHLSGNEATLTLK